MHKEGYKGGYGYATVCSVVNPLLGFQVDPSLLVELERALAGRPRQRDLVEAEVDDMLGGEGGGEMIGASAAGLLDDDDEDLLDDEVGGWVLEGMGGSSLRQGRGKH